MKKSNTTLIVVLIGCGILYYIADQLITTHAVPSLGEYMASSTAEEASSTEQMATSTAATSTDLISTTTASGTAAPSSSPALLTTEIVAPGGTISAMIADTDATKAQGLGDRASLPANEGMIFVFDTPGTYGFWMKDMEFPLDMVWIDAEKHVVGIVNDIAPDTYPETVFPPSPISYVLEINAGAAEKFGIATGTALSF